MEIFSCLQKWILEMIKNHPEKWAFWVKFISLRKFSLKGLTISNYDFGGVFPKHPEILKLPPIPLLVVEIDHP